MPEFSLRATYATRSGRPGMRDVVRNADTLADAMERYRSELAKRGNTKIDVQAWALADKKGLINA